MNIAGLEFIVKEIYDNIITIPDCFVASSNKIGEGHGEAKLYQGTKEAMRSFYQGDAGFQVKCFIVKQDLLSYLQTLYEEYHAPSQFYRGRNDFSKLWETRMDMINHLEDIIFFEVKDQEQIQGDRGYVNSIDHGYKIIRELSLPIVSYISAMRVQDTSNNTLFYWKLFVDFEAIQERKNGPLVLNYGRNHAQQSAERAPQEGNHNRGGRIGQNEYRSALLDECNYCPITLVNDERLLVASHIKPWAVSTREEQVDPKNGYILSPLYDALFDKGFITFTDDRRMLVSNWLSPKNCERLGLENNRFIQRLLMDDKRKEYLKYHREHVFKG